MKFILGLIVLIIVVIGGYFLLAKFYTPSDKTNTNQKLSCTTGINGNSGDNFCSNYHDPSSKCNPRLESGYPDGCTK